MKQKPKRSLVSVACELLAVLLITGTAFMWGKGVTLTERGYPSILKDLKGIVKYEIHE